MIFKKKKDILKNALKNQFQSRKFTQKIPHILLYLIKKKNLGNYRVHKINGISALQGRAADLIT